MWKKLTSLHTFVTTSSAQNYHHIFFSLFYSLIIVKHGRNTRGWNIPLCGFINADSFHLRLSTWSTTRSFTKRRLKGWRLLCVLLKLCLWTQNTNKWVTNFLACFLSFRDRENLSWRAPSTSLVKGNIWQGGWPRGHD